ncbi:MAG: prepilin-type N-terminal cleavage/methylation domain-containing protein [Myxococcota bacterium]
MDPRRLALRAFTLLELVFVMAITAILAALAMPTFGAYTERVRGTEAIVHMKSIEQEIGGFFAAAGRLPADLAAVGMDGLLDPWGNPYQYTNLATAPPGHARKDRFLVPINSDFDLYSMGPDGRSVPPLTARMSRDDIIRANDGSFYGRASAY